MPAITKAELQARLAKLERALAREKKRKGDPEALARARDAQAATAEILRVIRRSPSDVQPVFEAIADAAMRLFKAWSVTVVRFDGTHIQYGAARGARRGSEARVRAMFPRPPSKTNIVGRCILARKVIELRDARLDRSAAMRELAQSRGFRSALTAPLLNDRAPIGAISVTRVEAGPFARAEVELLQTFADQAVIAIENARRFRQTNEALERQTATAEILKVISGSPNDVQPVFDAVAHSSMRLLGALSASVSIRAGDTLQLGAFTSTSKTGDQAVKDLFPLSLTRNRDTILAQSVLKAAAAQVGDAQGGRRRPRLRQIARRRGFQSIIAVPMLRKGVAIGTVSVTRREAGGFSDHEVELLTTFADQAAIAIENVRLFNETKEALERQTAMAAVLKVISQSPTDVQPVFDAIAASAARLCEAATCTIFRRDGDRMALAAHHGPAAPGRVGAFSIALSRGSIAGRTVLDGRTLHVADIRAAAGAYPNTVEVARRMGGLGTMLSVPLMREGVAIGAIQLPRIEVRLFTDRQIALLETFADQAVIAIENVRLFNETKEALEHQTATSDVLRVISTSPTDVQPVLDTIAESAARLCESSDAQVLLLAEDELRIIAQHGSGIRSTIGSSLPLNRDSATARAVIDRDVVHIPDTSALAVGEFEQTRKNAVRGGWQSILSVPLLKDGAPVGAIAARRTKASPFTPQQIALLKTFADQAVIAIENVRLFNETKEGLERQTATAEILKVIASSPSDVQPVLEAVASSAARLCEAKDVTVLLREGDDLRYRVHHGEIAPGVPVGELKRISRDWGAGRCAADGRQLHIHDILAAPEEFPEGARMGRTAGYRTVLMTPLLRDGAVLGVIGMRRAEARPFDARQIELINTFADQAVIAIENVRLFNETKEALERQTATAEVLRAISASPTDTQPVFDIIAERAAALCGARDSVVLRYDGSLVSLAAQYNMVPEAGEEVRRAFPTTLEHNSAGIQSIRSGRVVQIRDVSELPDYHLAKVAQAGGARRMLAVPLLRGGQAIGAVGLAHAEPGQFSDHQIQLVKTFADQAVIAIENVRLFNETKEALERQTATAEILKVIAGSPSDVQPVFDAIVRAAAKLCDGRLSTVLRVDGEMVNLAAHHNLGDEGVAMYRQVYPTRVSRDLVAGCAILDRTVINLPDALDEAVPARSRALAAAGAFRAVLVVPMLREGEPIGIINVSRAEPGPFSEAHVELLKTFADQAVIAIENVRLFNETREALERQTASADVLKIISSSLTNVQPVFDAIVASAERLFSAKSAVLLLRGETHFSVGAYAGPQIADLPEEVREAPLDRTKNFPSRAMLGGEVVHIPNWQGDDVPEHERIVGKAFGIRAGLMVPLLRAGTGIGAIAVTRETEGAYGEKEIALLQSFADQAVIAIQNVRLFNETNEALERQTATAEILKVISSSPTDVQPVFDTIVKNAVELSDALFSAVYRFDGERLHLVAHQNYTPQVLELENRLYPMRPERGQAVGRAILDGRVIHIQDALTDTDYQHDIATTGGWRSMIAVPMFRDAAPVGVIWVARAQTGPFSDHQIELLETFADQAVIAIENVRLFNETKEALERQTATAEILKVIASSPDDVQPVFEAIVENAARLAAPCSCGINMREGDQIVFRAGAGSTSTPEQVERMRALFPIPHDPDRNLASQAIAEGRILHADPAAASMPEIAKAVSETTGARSITHIPLMRASEGIGTLTVRSTDPGFRLSERQLAVMQTFADQAVIAIENVRLFNETKEALERQTATSEILKVISGSPTDVQPVFETIVQSAVRLCDAVYSAVITLEGGMLHLVAYKNWPAEGLARAQQLFPMPLESDHLSAIAARENRVIHQVNLQDDPAVPTTSRELARITGYRALLIVPMVREDRSQGVIVVARRDPFSDDQIALLQTFADQAVIAIDNVRLFNETRDALEQQTASAEVLQVISSSLDETQPVFDVILNSCERLFRGRHVGITLVGEDGLAHFGAYHGPAAETFENMYPLPINRETGSGLAILERRILHYPDVQGGADVPESIRQGGKITGLQSVVMAPLLGKDRAVGAMFVGREFAGAFSDKEIALIKTFADQAVIAIENVRLFNETKEALEQQRASGEVLSVISNSIADAQPVFEKIVESCERLFASRRVGLNLVGQDGMVYAGAYGKLPGVEKFRTENFPHPATADSATGAAILARNVIHYPDALGDSDVPLYARRGAQALGFRAFIMAPLLSEERGLGAIFVGRETAGPFSDKEIALLKTFANQAVIAIQNARLFNETKEALERQTATAEILKVISASHSDVAPVLDAVVERAARICESDDAVLFVLEADRFRQRARFRLASHVPESHQNRQVGLDRSTIMGAAVLDRQPIQIEDLQSLPDGVYEEGRRLARELNHRATLAVPLLRDDAALGALLLRRIEARPFTDKQISLLRTFADQAAIGIENVRLFNELQQRTDALTKSVDQLTALGEVSQTLSSTLDLDKVLPTIVSRAVQLTGLDGGAIYEYDEARQVFSLRGGENVTPELVELYQREPIRLGEGAVGGAAAAREPVQIADIVKQGYESRARDVLVGAGARALLAVPLLREGHILGALAVIRNSPGEFAPEVVDLLKTFATQSAIAIQNARLFREIEDKGRQLEEASQHKSQFLASMSHELRTPLNAILGFNEMILGEVYGEVPGDMKEPLEDIQTSGKHLLRLINNVLDLAKIEAGRMELALADYAVQDMVESVRATLRPLAENKGLEFLVSVPNDLPLAHGDSGRLTQCLMNLAGNSLKFTKAGSVTISAEQNGDTLTFRVADTGIGIPPEKIDSLFTEFKQTDATIASEYGGTGLGLAITKQFIEMHGGRIWVESELGKGSSFIFEIPLRVEAGAAA